MPYFKTENSNAENIKYDNTKSVKEAIDEIKASSSSNPTAASVTFNNTDTGLNATNVQDAVTEVNGKLGKTIKTTGTAINFGSTTGLRTVNIPIPEALKGKTILSNTWVLESAYGTSAITTAIPFGSTSAITSRLLINNTQPYDVVAYIRWFYID